MSFNRASSAEREKGRTLLQEPRQQGFPPVDWEIDDCYDSRGRDSQLQTHTHTQNHAMACFA